MDAQSRSLTREPRIPAFLALPPVLALAGGCHNYAPADMEALTPQSEVRAVLHHERSTDLQDALGFPGSELEGEVVEVDERSVLLSVPVPRQNGRRSQPPVRQRVRLEESDIVQLEARTLDRRRTLGAVGALGAAAAFLLVQVVTGDDPGGTPRTPPHDGEL